MDASPPIPPPKNNSGNKTPRSEECDRPTHLAYFRKDQHGKYWFQLIPEENRENFYDMVRKSIMQYFTVLVNNGLYGSETSKEHEKYKAAANQFLGEEN